MSPLGAQRAPLACECVHESLHPVRVRKVPLLDLVWPVVILVGQGQEEVVEVGG